MATINTSRIAKNTLLLYIRMMILTIINLYTVRVVLKALGTEDYGIFNVVAGVITLFTSVSSVISTATQRFLSYSIGEKDDRQLNNIFIVSLNLFIVASLTIFIAAETIGLWFVNTHLIIPIERIAAANWVYQFSIITFIVTIVQTPYISVLIAHEDINIYSGLTILDYILKLILAFTINKIPYDKLIWYGTSLLLAQLFLLIGYQYICKKKYAECRYHFKHIKKKLYQDLLSFSGWTMLSSFASIGMYQLTTILINMFFGPIVTASRAISLQINSALFSMCNNFLTAIKSPMIRSYAEGNHSYLYRVFNASNKLVFYCLLMPAIPLILEMDTLLKFWLGQNDKITVVFSQLVVTYAILMTLNNPIAIIIQAIGDLKQYVLYSEFFTVLCIPLTYLCFKFGANPFSAYFVMISCTIAAHIVRLIILKQKFDIFQYKDYLLLFVMPAILVSAISVAIAFHVHTLIEQEYIRIAAVTIVSILSVSVMSYFWGLTSTEKDLIRDYYCKIRIKFVANS